jgi:hypothetical protein
VFNVFTGTLDWISVEDLSGYVTLDQTTPQTILNDTFKLDVLKSKTILGTDADGKIIEGTHQSLAGYVPYTGATGDVDLEANIISAKTFAGGLSQPYQSAVNRGSVSGGITVSGEAIVFNGTDALIVSGDDSSFNLSSGFSITGWVNVLDIASGGSIVAKGGGTTTQYMIDFRGTGTTRKLAFFGYESGVAKGDTTGSTTNFYEAGWKHFACTFDGTTWKTYVDNVLEREVSVPATLTHTTQVLTFGHRVGASARFKGSATSLQMFNKVLSQSEVTRLFKTGKDAYSSVTENLFFQYSGKDYIGSEALPTTFYNMIPFSKTSFTPYDGATSSRNQMFTFFV